MKIEDFYLQDVSNRWKDELKTSEDVYILSPCLSLETVRNVVQNGPKQNKGLTYNYYGIYTALNFENFLNGQSSIEAIRYLIENDYDVFSLLELSANIILIPDTFVSISSQNLTISGTKNKEATFISTDSKIINDLEKQIIENWLKKDCEQITLEMIEDIEEGLSDIKKLYQIVTDELEKAQIFVETKKSRRESEKAEENEKRKKRFEMLQDNIEKAEKILVVKGSVERRKELYTFIPESNSLKLQIKGKETALQKSKRYLSVIENTGKLGWARVSENRITQYHDAFKVNYPLLLNQGEYNVKFRANWELKSLRDYNLKIELNANSDQKSSCKIYVWFDLEKIELINFENSDTGIEHWIKNHEDEFNNVITSELLKSFKYVKNLAGKKADVFFGYKKEFELKIANIHNSNILIFKESNSYANFI